MIKTPKMNEKYNKMVYLHVTSILNCNNQHFFFQEYCFKHFSLYLHVYFVCLFTDSLIADIHKRITEAFEIFDNENNKTVDVRLVMIAAVQYSR